MGNKYKYIFDEQNKNWFISKLRHDGKWHDIGRFEFEKDAKEYCEWKNQKKIDRDFAEQMIEHFRSECFTESKWINDEYENLIEIIKLLSEES
jgi:hypothetical protein